MGTSKATRTDGLTSLCARRSHNACDEHGQHTRNGNACECTCHHACDVAPIGDVHALLGERGDVLGGRIAYAYSPRCGEYHYTRDAVRVSTRSLMRNHIGRTLTVANMPWRIAAPGSDVHARTITDPTTLDAMQRAARMNVDAYALYPCM